MALFDFILESIYNFLPFIIYLFLFSLYIIIIVAKNRKEGCTKSFSWFFLFFLALQILTEFFYKSPIFLNLVNYDFFAYNFFIIIFIIFYVISIPTSLIGYIIFFFGMDIKIFNKETKFIFPIIASIFYFFTALLFFFNFVFQLFGHSILFPDMSYQTYRLIIFVLETIMTLNLFIIGLSSIIIFFVFWKKNASFGVFSIYFILGFAILGILIPVFQFMGNLFHLLLDFGYLGDMAYSELINYYHVLNYSYYVLDLIKPIGLLSLSMGSYLTSVVPIKLTKKKINKYKK